MTGTQKNHLCTADRQHDARCNWHKPVGSCDCGAEGDGRSASVVEKFEDTLRDMAEENRNGFRSYTLPPRYLEAIANALGTLRYIGHYTKPGPTRNEFDAVVHAHASSALATLDALSTGNSVAVPDSDSDAGVRRDAR